MIQLSFKRLWGLVAIFVFICNAAKAQQAIAINKEMVYCLTAVKGTQPWWNPDERAHDIFNGDFQSAYQSIITSSSGSTPILPMIIIVEFKNTCAIQQMQFGYSGQGSTPLNVKVEFGRPGQWSAPGTWSGIVNGTQSSATQTFNTNLSLNTTNRFVKFTFSQVFRGGIKFIGSGDCSVSFPAYNPSTMPKTPMDRFLGTNSTIGLNNQRTAFMAAPFGSLREYLNWGWNEAGPEATETGTYPNNNRYSYAPSLPLGSDNNYDHLFRSMQEMGLDVLADMMSTTPGLISTGKNGNTETKLNATNACEKMQFWEQKPVNVPASSTSSLGNEFFIQDPNSLAFSDPTAYVRQADRLFQFTARYGASGPVQDSDLKFAATNTNKRYLKLVDYVENFNETDKWWFAPDPNGNCGTPSDNVRRRIYFTPLEYAAMTLADHNNPSVYNLSVPNSSKLGIYRADPNMKSVMSGISEFDVEYLKGIYMALWDLTGNTNAWPFKAVGLHHYAFEANHGKHPEQDFAEEFEASNGRLREIMQFVQNKLPVNTEVWVTEFGWSNNAADGSSALPAYGGADLSQVQAQWLLRQSLLYQSAGIQRAYQFSLLNTLSGGGGLFAFCGAAGMSFTSSGASIEFKPSWYAIYTMKNALTGMTFQQETTLQSTGQNIKQQRYRNPQTQQDAFVLWSPTENNISVNNVSFQTGAPNTEATIIQVANGKIEGNRTIVTTNANGMLTLNVPVGEMPVFVVMGKSFQPSCDCHVPISVVSDQAAAQNLANEQNKLDNSNLLCGFGPAMSQTWTASSGMANIWLKDKQNNNKSYSLFGVYINYLPGSNGQINIKFYNSDNQLIAYKGDNNGYTFTTDDFSAGFWGAAYTWRRLENLKMTDVARITVSVVSGNVTLGEVSVCGQLTNLSPGGGDNGNPPTDTTTVTQPTCPTPSGIAAVSAVQLTNNNSTVKVSWLVPSNAPATTQAYKLEYRRGDKGPFTPFTGSISQLSGNKMEATITGLTTCAEYRFRVNYTDTCGNVAQWRTRVRYLNGGCTLGTPTGTMQTAADCNKVMLKWNFGANTVGTNYTYQVRYAENLTLNSPTSNNSIAATNLPTVSTTNNAQTNFWLNGLLPGKTYRVFVRAVGNNDTFTPWSISNVSTKPLNQCTSCVCNWVPLSEDMVLNEAGLPLPTSIDAKRMVDEQEFIIDPQNPCELLPNNTLNGPSTEIGEFWGTPISEDIVARFQIALPNPGTVKHIRLYDGDGCITGAPDADGDGCRDTPLGFQIEYRRPNEITWNTVLNINTSKWKEWREFAVNDQVAAFRVTKRHNHARINEIAVCMSNTGNQSLVLNAQTPETSTLPFSTNTEIKPKIYPNPTTDGLNIDFPADMSFAFSVFSMSGNLLLKGDAAGSTRLSLGNLPKGAYVLQLYADRHTWSERILKD